MYIPGMTIQNAAAIAAADGDTPGSSVSLDLPTTEDGLGLRISPDIEVHTAHSPEGASLAVSAFVMNGRVC